MIPLNPLHPMNQYCQALHSLITDGQRASNRTGIDTWFKHGLYMTFDMYAGFPLLTLRRIPWKSCFAEMLGFVRGLDNAANFRELGTKVWDANANENEAWLSNPARKGTDDLGRIYGVQAREWASSPLPYITNVTAYIDQLADVYHKLRKGIDDRRLIVTHHNPGEQHLMALPPCHMFYQFGLRESEAWERHPSDLLEQQKALDLFVYIRSNDMGLGCPFNIAGYAFLLMCMARITCHLPGALHYFAWNYHLYENHMGAVAEMLRRAHYPQPTLHINPDIRTLSQLEQATLVDFEIRSYEHHTPIKMEMAV